MFLDITSPWRNRDSSARVSSPGRGARRSRRKWTPSVERFEERTLLSSTSLLASSPDPSTFGQPVTFTATVVSRLPSPPSGTVAFIDNSNMAILSQETVGSSGTATFTTSSLAVGIHVITAYYYSLNVPVDTSSSAPLTQVVNPIKIGTTTTTTTLASSSTPSISGQPVTFTATVAPTSGTGRPTGTVQFFDGTTQIGSETLNPTTGTATFATSSLAVGNHTIRAEYLGDSKDAGSTSAGVVQSVNQINTTTALASSSTPSISEQPVTFTATVTPTSGTGRPTGTVQFFDGTTQIDSETLNPTTGTATFATSSLAVGNHVITAQYLGDQNDASSTSAPLTQVVNPIKIGTTTTTALASSSTPSISEQPVTFTATVAPTNGTGRPTGTVQFFDGTTQIGSKTLDPTTGTATFVTSSLAVGNHVITAQYLGDQNDAGSTSAPLTQVVNPITISTTTLASSPNPSTFGQNVTFTATVTPTSGTGRPTGTVQFFDGTTKIGSGTLDATTGTTTFATSSLAVGNHSITAQYLGDQNDAGSTSAPLTHVVNPNIWY